MSRPPVFRASFDLLPGEICVDNFAGGGGASTGIEAALGRPVDIAINHSPEAIAMHAANHPETKHFCENIWTVDPRVACAGRTVGLAWFSPDCTHFSRAKGTTPVKKEIRGLADVVIRWAREVKPRVIIVENVEEFQTWGPLLDEDDPLGSRPDPTRAGESFRAWLAALVDCGYEVDYRVLVAADFGAPTTRKRLFLIARCDGRPIVWPEATHGKGRPESWRPAHEIIDWSLPCPSIFERARPLAEATLRRIAKGIERYVVDAPQPFIVKYYGTGGAVGVGAPVDTITTRDRFGLVSPFIAPLTHHDPARGRSVMAPLATVTGANRGELALISPFVVRHGHYSTITGAGLREGCGAGTFRGQPLEDPLATVCATNDKHLVCPVVIKHYGGVVGHGVERPIGTVTGRDHHALAAAFITKFHGTSTGSSMTEPAPTVLSGGGKGGGHLGEVRAFLMKFHGGERGHTRGQQLGLPLRTIDTANRFGLVMIYGEPHEIVDIGMRMLQPHELFGAQGFPETYEISPLFRGKPLTKTAQTSLAGNSVCPPVARALVLANARAA